MFAWVVCGYEKGFACLAWPLINTGRVGVKVRVGLEKLFYKTSNTQFKSTIVHIID